MTYDELPAPAGTLADPELPVAADPGEVSGDENSATTLTGDAKNVAAQAVTEPVIDEVGAVPAPDDVVEPDVDPVVMALDKLTSELASFHQRASAQEDIIAKMHARIEVLQRGEAKKWLRPLSVQLATLYSEVSSTADAVGPDTTPDQFSGLLEGISLSVEQLLDQLGLSPLGTSIGDTFDPRLHAAAKKVATSDQALDRTVANVLRQGFADPGDAKPVVPSRVSVYRYEVPPADLQTTVQSGDTNP